MAKTLLVATFADEHALREAAGRLHARGGAPANGVTEDVFAIVLRLRHPAAADEARVLLGNSARDVIVGRAS